MIRKNIELFIEKYNKWSTYTPEENSVLIAYSSVYGGTESAVNLLASKLADKGIKNIRRNQEKLGNSFAETQTELKTLKSRMNNAEE